jgi:O-antigen/teichoic acid export membrane protein
LGLAGSPVGLIVGDLAGGILNAAALRGHRVTLAPRASLLEVGFRFRRFPLIATWSALANGAAQQILIPLSILAFGSATTGQLGLAVRLAALPSFVIGQAFARSFLGDVGHHVRTNPQVIKSLVLRRTKHLALVGAPIFLLMGLTASRLVPFVFGSSWAEAGTFVSQLSPAAYAGFVAVPLATLNQLDRQSWQLGWDVSRLVTLCGLFGFANSQNLSVSAFVTVYSAVAGLFYGILYLLMLRAAARATVGTS